MFAFVIVKVFAFPVVLAFVPTFVLIFVLGIELEIVHACPFN